MELKIKRKIFADTYTIGRWSANGIDLGCDSLEDAVRDTKVYGETAIPEGRYEVVISYSPRFKKDMPLLVGIPNYEGVRIHSFNKSTETEGCLGAGVHDPNYNGGDWISTSAYWTGVVVGKVVEAINNNERVWVTIEG